MNGNAGTRNRLLLLLETILFTAHELMGDVLRNYQIVRMAVGLSQNNPVDVPENQRAYIPAIPPAVDA